MGQLVNIGFGNIVNFEKVLSIINPDSAPSKRLVQSAKEDGRIIDGTQGRRTKSILILETNHVVLSSLQPDTLVGRFSLGTSGKSNNAEGRGKEYEY